MLGRQLGPTLFQLPPNMKKDHAKLQAFLARLPHRLPSIVAGFDAGLGQRVDDLLACQFSLRCKLNRGNMLIPGFINNPTPLLLEKGFTLVWSGWQGDLARVGQNLIGSFPTATQGGQPIVALSREEFVDRGTAPWTGALQYAAATLDRSQATLTVRERERDARQPISTWEYVNDRQIRVTPPGAPFDSSSLAPQPASRIATHNPMIESLSIMSHTVAVLAASASHIGTRPPSGPRAPGPAVPPLAVGCATSYASGPWTRW